MAKVILENLTFGQATAIRNYLKDKSNLKKIMGNVPLPTMENSTVDTKTHEVVISFEEKNEYSK